MTPWSQDVSPRRGGSEREIASERWKGEVSSPSKVDLYILNFYYYNNGGPKKQDAVSKMQRS